MPSDFAQGDNPCNTCDALRDLVPFVQFKKCENTHGGVLLLVTVILWCKAINGIWYFMGLKLNSAQIQT